MFMIRAVGSEALEDWRRWLEGAEHSSFGTIIRTLLTSKQPNNWTPDRRRGPSVSLALNSSPSYQLPKCEAWRLILSFLNFSTKYLSVLNHWVYPPNCLWVASVAGSSWNLFLPCCDTKGHTEVKPEEKENKHNRMKITFVTSENNISTAKKTSHSWHCLFLCFKEAKQFVLTE